MFSDAVRFSENRDSYNEQVYVEPWGVLQCFSQ